MSYLNPQISQVRLHFLYRRTFWIDESVYDGAEHAGLGAGILIIDLVDQFFGVFSLCDAVHRAGTFDHRQMVGLHKSLHIPFIQKQQRPDQGEVHAV